MFITRMTTPGKVKNLPDHGGNGTRNLWFAGPMLCQLSYEVKSVRVCDISELKSSSFDIRMFLLDHDFLYGVMYSGVECVCGVTLSVYPHRAS